MTGIIILIVVLFLLGIGQAKQYPTVMRRLERDK